MTGTKKKKKTWSRTLQLFNGLWVFEISSFLMSLRYQICGMVSSTCWILISYHAQKLGKNEDFGNKLNVLKVDIFSLPTVYQFLKYPHFWRYCIANLPAWFPQLLKKIVVAVKPNLYLPMNEHNWKKNKKKKNKE